MRHTIGGDLALVSDASAFVAVATRGTFFDVEDILELRPSKGSPLKLSEVCKSACEFAALHNAAVLHVDHHVLHPAREHMAAGISLKAVAGGQAAKVERFVTVRSLLNEGRVRIPRTFVKLANQLREVLSKPASGGGLLITMPRRAGVHGDVASAFVLALHAAARRSGAPAFQPPVTTSGSSFFGPAPVDGFEGNGSAAGKVLSGELAAWAVRTGLIR